MTMLTALAETIGQNDAEPSEAQAPAARSARRGTWPAGSR